MLIIRITIHALDKEERIVKNYFKANKEVANEVEAKIRDLLGNSNNSITMEEESRQLLEEAVF